MRKFTNTQRAAIKNYYKQQQLCFREQSKDDCLEMICITVRNSRNIRKFEACAGTFFFTWVDGTTTIHNKKNWWRMKKVTSWR
jgi:hypothetical protein